jgi:hypothetical protein
MRNRGLETDRFPFAGLSQSTIRGMLHGRCHTHGQLFAMAGPLGWAVEDLSVVAGETPENHGRDPILCRHVGLVYLAAVPLGTEQLIQAAREADRLSARVDRGVWKPVNYFRDPCPDRSHILHDATR